MLSNKYPIVTMSVHEGRIGRASGYWCTRHRDTAMNRGTTVARQCPVSLFIFIRSGICEGRASSHVAPCVVFVPSSSPRSAALLPLGLAPGTPVSDSSPGSDLASGALSPSFLPARTPRLRFRLPGRSARPLCLLCRARRRWRPLCRLISGDALRRRSSLS